MIVANNGKMNAKFFFNVKIKKHEVPLYVSIRVEF